MEKIRPNIGFAIELFNESIQHKNDKSSKYNLANIYFEFN